MKIDESQKPEIRQNVFDYFANEHGIQLLDGDMNELFLIFEMYHYELKPLPELNGESKFDAFKDSVIEHLFDIDIQNIHQTIKVKDVHRNDDDSFTVTFTQE